MNDKGIKDSFASLGANLILQAAESTGHIATGRMQQLNSMENRVYSVEIEDAEAPKGVSTLIVKFYRPERWSAKNLVSEHALMQLLAEENIPTPALVPICDSRFLKNDTPSVSDLLAPAYRAGFLASNSLGFTEGFAFAVWRKVVGRIPLELTKSDLLTIGRTVARMHNLFETHILPKAFARPKMSIESFAYKPLENLIAWGRVPRHFQAPLFDTIESIAHGLHWVENSCDFFPVHGDLHRLNLMQTTEGGEFWFVDYDDCILAPEIQDLWLLASTCCLNLEETNKPEEDTDSVPKDLTKIALDFLVEGYEEFRHLPIGWDCLVEPLRTLRMIYYPGWIAGRWHDPFFRSTFTFFDEPDYWEKLYFDLCDQKEKLEAEGLLDYT